MSAYCTLQCTYKMWNFVSYIRFKCIHAIYCMCHACTCTYSFPVNRDLQSQISWKYYNIHGNCTYHYVHSVHNTKKIDLYITYIWPILWHINMFQVTKYISFDWNVDFCKNLEIFFRKSWKSEKILKCTYLILKRTCCLFL